MTDLNHTAYRTEDISRLYSIVEDDFATTVYDQMKDLLLEACPIKIQSMPKV